MIYLFGLYIVISAVVIGYLVWSILEVQSRGREDVDKLQKRLIMSMKPDVLVADSMDGEPPGPVEYMDDERMAAMDKR